MEVGERGIEQLPHQSLGEIAVGLLDQQQVAVLPDVTQVCELVLVILLAFDLGGIGVELARLADEVERDVGERHVLFQHRRMPAPFRQPVTEDQRIVGAAQGVEHQRCFGDLGVGARHHMCPTSSGTS